MTLALHAVNVFPFKGEPWMERAPCKNHDGDLWFVDDSADTRLLVNHQRVTYPEARKICATCPFTGLDGPCLEYALASHADWGLWAGFSPQERRAIMKERERGRRRVRA